MLPESQWSKSVAADFSLYLHIPFCLSRCRYCAFYSTVANPVPEKEYLAALLNHFQVALADWQGRRLRSVYLGGGTPSLLSPSFYSTFFNRLFSHFHEHPDIEITLEANPATLSREKIREYQFLGINRFSLGAQTFADQGLTLLGRRHSSADIHAAAAMLYDCGVENLSLDLIYAYPGQTLAGLRRDLEMVVTLEPTHVSAYCLALEPGTPLANDVQSGRLPTPTADDQCRFMEETARFLSASGYEHYEISNFCRPGRRSRHNLAYWELKDYWGLGAGAWSAKRLEKNAGCWAVRYLDESDVKKYLRRFGGSEGSLARPLPVETDAISYQTSFAERLIMGLRLVEGVDLAAVADEYDHELVKQALSRLEGSLREGLVERVDDRLRLTSRGLLLADEIALILLD